jgi:hypothetical protein
MTTWIRIPARLALVGLHHLGIVDAFSVPQKMGAGTGLIDPIECVPPSQNAPAVRRRKVCGAAPVAPAQALASVAIGKSAV